MMCCLHYNRWVISAFHTFEKERTKRTNNQHTNYQKIWTFSPHNKYDRKLKSQAIQVPRSTLCGSHRVITTILLSAAGGSSVSHL